jgi:hypothetical protein
MYHLPIRILSVVIIRHVAVRFPRTKTCLPSTKEQLMNTMPIVLFARLRRYIPTILAPICSCLIASCTEALRLSTVACSPCLSFAFRRGPSRSRARRVQEGKEKVKSIEDVEVHPHRSQFEEVRKGKKQAFCFTYPSFLALSSKSHSK